MRFKTVILIGILTYDDYTYLLFSVNYSQALAIKNINLEISYFFHRHCYHYECFLNYYNILREFLFLFFNFILYHYHSTKKLIV